MIIMVPEPGQGLFMFLSPKGALIVSIEKCVRNLSMQFLQNLALAVFPKND